MINYFIEFTLLHTLFLVIYKLLLAKETQLSFLRLYLLVATLLSLIVPLVQIPSAAVPAIGFDTILLPEVTTTLETPVFPARFWLLIPFCSISFFFALKLLVSIAKIYKLYYNSTAAKSFDVKIRKVSSLQNSFTFFHWIFIDPDSYENPEDLIHHEHCHSKRFHSADVVFFHILAIVFWWSPSLWLFLSELKLIHEYEADDYAMKINDTTYTKTLVRCTLKKHGIHLASAFNHAPILNRLNFIKKMKKKISTSKKLGVVSLMIIASTMFACSENMEEESAANPVDAAQEVALETTKNTVASIEKIYTMVDETASFTGGQEAWGAYLQETLKYPKEAVDANVEGRVFVQFIVEKDGSLSDVHLVRGIGHGCDKEALRVVQNAPKWISGKIDGTAVRQRYIQYITYKLNS